ncbi:iron complex outermembrane receptor protein [Novosphingobium chloroacetimidivorans]|uniref:Iron complex outermembrane receptor protein n=1 Tax=Novosphingobium chloroacetimidivorans TaxID=1428314 RepID=A0A7W7NYB3_9SPHN|nr:TonB-dependent receptor [Novosphingobium chloroacetimidivorans]MBB4860284.1 iron complex outermembrane receptor protein [Novosphingobium chloroacetimidivorans]
MLASAMTLLGVSLPAMVSAQVVPPEKAAGAGPANVGVEDIVVTAERRESRLQDVPISVTAISAAGLESRGIRNFASLDATVPNLQLNNGRPDGGGSAAAATIRGVGQNDFQFPNDPGVGTYIDGVYLARSLGGLLSVLDIDRIEVLRGPQGTLFGRNTIGGAINITSKAPTNEAEGVASLTYGSYNRVEAKLAANVPLIDGKLAARMSAGYIRADGIGEQIPTGLELGIENRKIVRLALRGTPSNDVTIDFSIDYTNQRQNGGALFFIPDFPSSAGLIENLFNPVLAPVQNAQLGLPAASRFDGRWASPSRYDNYGTAPMRDNLDAGGASLTLTWNVTDNVTFKTITAARALEARISNDLDLSPYSVIQTDDTQHQEQYSQEVQIYGTLLDGKLDFLLGGYYFKEIGRSRNFVPILPGTLDVFGFEISQRADLGLNVNNYAGFGQFSYKLTDRLKLTAGFRQNYESKRFSRKFTHIEGGDVFIPQQDLYKSWNAFTPKFGIDWKASEDILIYGSYAKGFKSGGWNPRPIGANTGTTPFGPEKIQTYELGAKTQWFDRRLTLNVAAFHSIYSDIQLQALTTDASGALISDTRNAGRSRLWGAEVELVARPVPEASIQISGGYLTNKYTELNFGTDVQLSDKLPDAPRWSFAAGGDYHVELLGFGTVTPRVDVAYRSKTYRDGLNSPAITQPGYWLTNVRLSIVPDAIKGVDFQLFATNLFDRHYISYGQNVKVQGYSVAGYGRPRELGVTARYRF